MPYDRVCAAKANVPHVPEVAVIRSIHILFSSLLLLIPASPSAAQRGAAGPPQTVEVIENITLIDGRGGPPVADAAVVVRDGRIVAAGPRATIDAPADARRVDGHGGFLVPGFIDAHAHIALGPLRLTPTDSGVSLGMDPDPDGSRITLRLLLANGITTIRDPGGPAERTVALRDSVAAGQLVGPRMVVAGEIIDRTPFAGLTTTVTTADDVRAEVRRQAEIGVDIIKLYHALTPELTGAGIDEAHRLGLPAITHPMLTTWTEAAALGVDGIVHILGWSPRMLPEGKRDEFLAMLGSTQFMYGWLELADLDSPEIRNAITALVEHDVILDPTLVVFERAVRGDDVAITGNAALVLAPPALVANWRSSFRFDLGWSADDYRRAREAWPKALSLTKRLFDAGVILAAGTDANNPWIVPGESFHRELELLVDAGISPLDVLTIATRNGAMAAGLLDDTGTIEPGKRADLVLLRDDPVAAISATRSIVWVMKHGTR